VTGTENILMAAALAEGETRLENSAREPEVTDLVELLIKMGAQIEGAGTSTLDCPRRGALARSIARDHSRPHRGGTFVVAGAITGGDIEVTDCHPEHLRRCSPSCAKPGVEIEA
jgi:UDP-N-acetylglucosamine 1-carboxyvinyltransferase